MNPTYFYQKTDQAKLQILITSIEASHTKLNPLGNETSHTKLNPQGGETSHTKLNPQVDETSHTKLNPQVDETSHTKLNPQVDETSHTKLNPQGGETSHTKLNPQVDESSSLIKFKNGPQIKSLNKSTNKSLSNISLEILGGQDISEMRKINLSESNDISKKKENMAKHTNRKRSQSIGIRVGDSKQCHKRSNSTSNKSFDFNNSSEVVESSARAEISRELNTRECLKKSFELASKKINMRKFTEDKKNICGKKNSCKKDFAKLKLLKLPILTLCPEQHEQMRNFNLLDSYFTSWSSNKFLQFDQIRDRYNDTRLIADTVVRTAGITMNASYVNYYQLTNPSKCTSNDIICLHPSYILAQCPVHSTLNNFFLMCLNEDVECIINLTNQSDLLVGKALDYLSCLPIKTASIFVKIIKHPYRTIEKVPGTSIEITQISVKNNSKRKTINYVNYTEWPDRSVPAQNQINTLRRIISTLHSISSNKILIHCSAGLGRSGVFLGMCIAHNYFPIHSLCAKPCGKTCLQSSCSSSLSSSGITQALTKESYFNFVLSLRKQRHGCVQTLEQYQWLWSYIENLSNNVESLKKIIDARLNERKYDKSANHRKNYDSEIVSSFSCPFDLSIRNDDCHLNQIQHHCTLNLNKNSNLNTNANERQGLINNFISYFGNNFVIQGFAKYFNYLFNTKLLFIYFNFWHKIWYAPDSTSNSRSELLPTNPSSNSSFNFLYNASDNKSQPQRKITLDDLTTHSKKKSVTSIRSYSCS
jgi:protein tyrosine phosphatase